VRKMTRYRDMLQSVSFLRNLSDADIAQLADALQPHAQRTLKEPQRQERGRGAVYKRQQSYSGAPALLLGEVY
jgi:hypothetical protein